MRNLLICLGLMGISILTVSCTLRPSTPQRHNPLAIPGHGRFSRAPTDTVTVDFRYSEHDPDVKFRLTLANSTAESIELPLGKYGCYRDTFWFYIKTEMGWHPMMSALSAKCAYSEPGELIPSGLERELDLGYLALTRRVGALEPASYMLRIKYTDSARQEFQLYTDEFSLETPAPIDKFGITAEKVVSNALDLKVTNHSNQPVWLAPLCSSSQLGGGTIDEVRSILQRLTKAGAWSNLQVECKQASTVIEIQPDETMIIDGRQWLENAGLSLQPGQYRWDLMFFLQALDEPELSAVGEGRHIFSNLFSVGD